MLRVYDHQHNPLQPLTNYQGLCITEEINAETQISFYIPIEESQHVQEEYYVRTEDNEYIIKEKIFERYDTLIRCIGKINIEELKGTAVKYFETIAKTPKDCLDLALSYCPGNWTCQSDIVKRRTLRQSQKNVWAIIQSALNLYMAEIQIDAINKVITITREIGEDKGSYFMEAVNIERLEVNSDTYDLVTRIYPVGKDGLTIEEVNGGLPYVENKTWTTKTISMYWEDNRYTIPENLRDDALEKLRVLSKPVKSYHADVVNLALAANRDIFDYNLGDTIYLKSKSGLTNEKHRIVSLRKYPDEPEKNTCTLSTNLMSLVNFMEDNLSASEAVKLVMTQQGTIDSSKLEAGSGLPSGGLEGQVLAKYSDADYEVYWTDQKGGEGMTIDEIEAIIQIKTHNIQDAAITNAKIGTAAITEANIADLAVGTAKIANGAITSAKIADATITRANIALATIDSTLIKDGAILNAKIADGAISRAKIGYGEIETGHIENGAITNALIANLAVTEAKIADLSVSSAKILNAAVLSAKIADAAIITAKIANLAVTTAKISDAAITTAKIADASITEAKIADAAITRAKIGYAAIGEANIADLSVSTAKIADGAITHAKIGTAEITGANIALAAIDSGLIKDGAITSAKIADGIITSAKIGLGEIKTANIDDAAITTAKIANLAVKEGQIDSLAVTSAKIADGAILTAKIGDGQITTAKIANAAINSANIADAAITSAKIADASITSAKILELDAGLITTGTLQTERLYITGETSQGIKSIVFSLNEINGTPQLSQQTIDGGSITERTITANQIMANSITGNEIEANTINATHIQSQTITGDKIASGTITADKIQGNSITLGQLSQEAYQQIIQEGKDYTDQMGAYFGEFLKFDQASGLTIGNNSADFKTVISDSEIGFYNGATKVAYIASDNFYLTKGTIENELAFGHYVFYPQPEGNLSIIWRD